MRNQISLTDAQANLEQLCDRVITTGELVIINRSDGKNVVLISEAELWSLLETLYLLRSPENAARLTAALERSNSEEIQPQSIDELCKRLALEDDTADNSSSDPLIGLFAGSPNLAAESGNILRARYVNAEDLISEQREEDR